MITYTIKIEETEDGQIDIHANAPQQVATTLEGLAAQALSKVIANFIKECGHLETHDTEFKRIGIG